MTTIIDGTAGVTFPAGGVGNPAGAVVGTTDTQTLTNKTLTAPTLASANITTALTLTGASGTSGQALTSGGSGVAPTWTTIGASAATPTALGTVYGKTDASALTFIGYNAGVNSSGTGNTALGYVALQTNTTGNYNTAVGWNAGQAATGSENTFVGVQAGSASTGSYNVAIGKQALQQNTSGASNTGLGFLALGSVTTGASNTAVGTNALKAMTTTNSNVAVGESAGTATTTGYENVFIGAGAGSNNTTGYFNVFIGNKAGQNNGPTTGSTNTIIGNDARVTASNSNTQLVVAARQSATAKGDNTGFIDGGTGGIYQGNNSSSWSTTSDFRLKKNIVDNTQGLDIISQVRVRNFEYRTAEEVTELPEHTVVQKEGVQLGVIAQELQQVCSDCVKIETTGVMSVDSDN